MLTTDTINIGSGSTVVDLWSLLVSSSTPTDQTPGHEVTVQNNGAGTFRVGSLSAVSTGNGVKVAPGETFSYRLQNPNRLGVVGDAGAAAAAVTVMIQVKS